MHTELEREDTSMVFKHTRLEAFSREFSGLFKDKRHVIVKRGYKAILKVDNPVVFTQELGANA